MTRQRPSGITLVAIWLFLSGLFNVGIGAVVAFFWAEVFRWLSVVSAEAQALQLLFAIVGLVLMATGIGMLVLGWGLLEGRGWARTWSVATTGISALAKLILVAAVPMMITGTFLIWPLFVLATPALIDLLALFYLLSDEARAYCSEYGPAPGAWSPIQETEPAARPVGLTPETPSPTPSLPRTELVAPPVSAAAWLVSRPPGRAGRQFPLQAARNIIGRGGSRCQVVLDDPTVSGEHAAIVFEHGRFVLYDLASTNGTFLNDQRIQRQMLYDGDEIRLGKKELVFKKV
jgi:hypothetical protein